MKRCPPGIICIESITSLFFLLIVFVIVGWFIYVSYNKNQGQNLGQQSQSYNQDFGLETNYPYNNLYNGVRNNMMDNTPINGV